MFRLNRLTRICLLVASTCSLTGCAFEREWQAAQGYAWPENELAGCWEGTWHSNWNGHNGGLRAIITKLNDDEYYARFHATYMRVLTFGQAVNLQVKQDGTNFTFSGAADLGKTYGGVYTYEGNSSPEGFYSTYKCSIDHGTFRMTRPKN